MLMLMGECYIKWDKFLDFNLVLILVWWLCKGRKIKFLIYSLCYEYEVIVFLGLIFIFVWWWLMVDVKFWEILLNKMNFLWLDWKIVFFSKFILKIFRKSKSIEFEKFDWIGVINLLFIFCCVMWFCYNLCFI